MSDEIDDIQHEITARAPELATAIEAKIFELQRRRQNWKQAKKHADDKKKSNAINKKVVIYKSERRTREVEELRGDIRELSESMAAVVRNRSLRGLTAAVQEGKHGKRNRPGEGKRTWKAREEAAEESD